MIRFKYLIILKDELLHFFFFCVFLNCYFPSNIVKIAYTKHLERDLNKARLISNVKIPLYQ